MSTNYHLDELGIARDPSHPAHILPPPLPREARILDVGCGAGQTLIAAYPKQNSVGVDVDGEALAFGRTLTNRVQFVQARAEHLPFAPGQFDAAIARVSLAYTDLPRSIPELRRVLKRGGMLWLVLHPVSIPWSTARAGGPKAWIFFTYIAATSLLFHFVGKMFSFGGRYESFQTSRGMIRALGKHGFSNVTIAKGRHFVLTAVAT